MLNLQWNALVLYPAGHFSRRIQVAASVTLPAGWGYGCALEGSTTEGDVTRFKPVALDALVDSPLFAGRHYRSIDLEDGRRVRLNLVADRAALLAATPRTDRASSRAGSASGQAIRAAPPSITTTSSSR